MRAVGLVQVQYPGSDGKVVHHTPCRKGTPYLAPLGWRECNCWLDWRLTQGVRSTEMLRWCRTRTSFGAGILCSGRPRVSEVYLSVLWIESCHIGSELSSPWWAAKECNYFKVRGRSRFQRSSGPTHGWTYACLGKLWGLVFTKGPELDKSLN
jgi:hypothetical protein